MGEKNNIKMTKKRTNKDEKQKAIGHKKSTKKNPTKMFSGPSGLPYYALPLVVWVN